jgi:DnaD/phage-associated family protein
MARPEGFICKDEYLKKLAKLSDQEVGRLFRALMKYHKDGETQELAGRESVAFDFIQADIDSADAAYAEKCATNRKNRNNDGQRPSTTDNDRQRPSTDAPNYNSNYNDNKEIDNDATARARETAFGVVDADPVIIAIQRELTGLTVSHYDDLAVFRQDLPDDLIVEAVNEAVAHGVRTWAYVRTILQGYIKDGIKTVGQAKERSERRKQSGKQVGKTVSAQQYAQRSYTEGELESRVDDL